MVKVRVLVRVVSFLRSRERAFLSDDVVVPFRLKTMKREQQKTPNDARQKRSRGDATGKSRPRGHAKTASAFIDDIFSSDDETIKARSAQNAFLGNVFTERRFWVGIPDGGVSGPLVLKQELTFICISLSLSLATTASKTHNKTDWENQNLAPAAEGNREIRVLHLRLVGLRRRHVRRVVVHLGANAPV